MNILVKPKMITRALLAVFGTLISLCLAAQCPTIGSTDVTFSRDGVCAPVTVTGYTVTYTFIAAQDPDDVVIRFTWNDAGTTIDEFANGSGLVASGGNTVFEATGTFIYDPGNECSFEPEVSLVFQGDVCETSSQTVFAWDDDDSFGGVLAIDPNAYNICENTAITNAVFTDNSTFNCNPNAVDPGIANTEARHTQFVYGTNHNAASSIRDLTLDDGGTVTVTDGTGALSSADTRGTAGELVTGGYFGAITEVPFAATGPNNTSLAISAPANAANAVGNTFEITLFNWNTCNPYNGDAANPNYEDAVRETVTIEVVEPPTPNYQTRSESATGTLQTLFCLQEDIYFENLTTGGGTYDYTWEFYDDNTGTTLLGNSNDENPLFSFSNPGEKLIRLTASDPGVANTCEFVFEDMVTLSPDAIAGINILDATLTNSLDPVFCQDGSTTYTVGFRDATTAIEPETEWRWEFLDESGVLVESLPSGTGTYSATQITDFTRDFTSEGFTVVRLLARNNVTLCESLATDTIFVYDEPIAFFESDVVCAGSSTTFSNIADSISSATLPVRVNDDRVILYEWDFSYDGVTFNVEHDTTINDDFSWNLDGTDIALEAEPVTSVAGTYTVALRLTTEKGSCEGLHSFDVTVNPGPDVSFSLSTTDACPGESIVFVNESSNPALTVDYTLGITHHPSSFSSDINIATDSTLLSLVNPDDTTRTYQLVLTGLTTDGCMTATVAETVEVFASEAAGFSDVNYSFSSTNCSPWNSTLSVDTATQNLLPDAYNWYIIDSNDSLLSGYPVGKISSDADFHELAYELVNSGASIASYQIILEVEKAGLCVDNDTFDIQIGPEASSAFTVTASENCEQKSFDLVAGERGSLHNWIFDPAPDARLDNGDQQMVIYNRPAAADQDLSLNFALQTTNIANCASDTTSIQESVLNSEAPILALFTVSADTLQLPDSVATINNLSSEGLGYLWTFGDGDSSTVFDPQQHTFTDRGTYEITLEVSNTFCSESFTDQIVVLPADPVVDFKADTLSGCSPLTIRFENLSEFAQSGGFLWDFGDGNSSRGDEAVHTFIGAGVYEVRLRGQNEVGVFDEEIKTAYINVSGAPLADFIATPRIVYIPDQEVFFRSLSENAVTFNWDFGDGDASTEENPTHAFAQEGFYDIRLVVENELGCVDTLFREAEVQAIIGGESNTPNAFTPSLNGPTGGELGLLGNSDPFRTNDVFLPKTEGVVKFSMYIYNKWGQLLFFSDDQNVGWDGYFRGSLAPAGVYVYRLELTFSDGREEVKVSDLTLLR